MKWRLDLAERPVKATKTQLTFEELGSECLFLFEFGLFDIVGAWDMDIRYFSRVPCVLDRRCLILRRGGGSVIACGDVHEISNTQDQLRCGFRLGHSVATSSALPAQSRVDAFERPPPARGPI